MLVEKIAAEPFEVPLREPFTISRASVASTRAVLVRARARAGGRTVEGYGEAALPLGSREGTDHLASEVARAAGALQGRSIADATELGAVIDGCFDGLPVSRSALHSALVDALGRLCDQPVYALFGGSAVAVHTDITLPIADPAHLAELATQYWGEGFRCFKVKVGADAAADRRTLELVAAATPGASLRLDANEGCTPHGAVGLLRAAATCGLVVECFEQPCPRADLDAMRRVREEGGVPVVADEAVRSVADLERIVAARAADGVNLKLVKMGGIDRCIAIGRLARDHGLRIMVGAMIESRLGLTAMAHVVAVLGGADWVDLDTAFLLAHDPCMGGMRAEGPLLSLPSTPGLGIELRDRPAA
jgi:L-alanine-DL-glutamate epimerase-like enolase superfamily enzyme